MKPMEGKADADPVAFRDGRALLGKMGCETVNATLREVLATCSACMRVTVGIFVELGTLQDKHQSASANASLTQKLLLDSMRAHLPTALFTLHRAQPPSFCSE